MSSRGCVGSTIYVGLLVIAFGASSYFWFTFFVRGRSIPTPNLIGRTIAEARAITSDQGLVVVVDNEKDRHSDKVPPGGVAWQNRAAGDLIKRGTRIYVGQSLGPLVLQVPDLSGQSPRTALLRFSQRNLKLGNLTYVDRNAKGIIAEDPPRGTVVQGQTPISLLVAYPPHPPGYVMPDVIDRTLVDVRSRFDSVGLTVTNVRYESYPGLPDGVIIRQYPLPGSRVRPDDAITLVVTRQEEEIATPLME